MNRKNLLRKFLIFRNSVLTSAHFECIVVELLVLDIQHEVVSVEVNLVL